MINIPIDNIGMVNRRQYGNIRDVEAYIETIWDWSFLNDCFGYTNIRITDGDGMVERNSHLLILETKRPNTVIPGGQYRMFCNLRATGLVTTIVIWGNTNAPTHLQCFYPYPDYTTVKAPVDEQELKGWVANWFDYANNTPWRDAVTRAMTRACKVV